MYDKQGKPFERLRNLFPSFLRSLGLELLPHLVICPPLYEKSSFSYFVQVIDGYRKSFGECLSWLFRPFHSHAPDLKTPRPGYMACVRPPSGEAQRDLRGVLVHLLSSRARGEKARGCGIQSDEERARTSRAGTRGARVRRPQRRGMVPVRAHCGASQHPEQESLRRGSGRAS